MPIELKGLSHSYPSSRGDVLALDDIDLTIKDSKITAVIGHTGSGKSTLLQHLNGLIPAQTGEVIVDGIGLVDAKTRKRARHLIGMAFQFPEKQLFAQTVEDDVAYGLESLELQDGDRKSRVRDALSSMGLDFDSISELSPFELSGGQQRRVALAGIMVCNPQYLVLDEPTCGLDPIGRASFVELIRNMRDNGTTVVFASHDMELVASCCDEVAVLDHGHLALQGTPEEVFSQREMLESSGLCLPRAAAFAQGLTEDGRWTGDYKELPLTISELADWIASALNSRGGGRT